MSLEEINGNHYGVKTLSMKAEDVDVKSRKVKFYLATFDVKDAVNDVIRKGAFTKSLSEKGVDAVGNRRIQHLRNHDWNQLVGKFVELYEDNVGLVGVSELGRSTKGNDTLLDYQDGLIREHSIGFKNIAGKKIRTKDNTHGIYNNITEVNLFEGSSVTFGANSLTPVLDVTKGLKDDSEVLNKIENLTEDLSNAIKSGGTDDRLYKIELMFAQLKQLQHSLKDLKPSNEDTLNLEPTNEEARKQILIKLIKNDRI